MRYRSDTASATSGAMRVRYLLAGERPFGTLPCGFPQETRMSFSLSIGPVVALIAGILILIIPRLLNYIIALYLIIVGVLGLMGDPRPRIGADASDVPPAAVQHAIPARVTPAVGI